MQQVKRSIEALDAAKSAAERLDRERAQFDKEGAVLEAQRTNALNLEDLNLRDGLAKARRMNRDVAVAARDQRNRILPELTHTRVALEQHRHLRDEAADYLQRLTGREARAVQRTGNLASSQKQPIRRSPRGGCPVRR